MAYHHNGELKEKVTRVTDEEKNEQGYNDQGKNNHEENKPRIELAI